jgi:hypothetical protein
MQLIFEYNWCIEHEASGTEIFVIECDSIIKLQVYVLDEIKAARKDNFLTIFNMDFYNLDSLEIQIQIQDNIYTLDEWCGKKIIKIK